MICSGYATACRCPDESPWGRPIEARDFMDIPGGEGFHEFLEAKDLVNEAACAGTRTPGHLWRCMDQQEKLK